MTLTPAQIENDIAFWLNQDREHNLFFALGFEDPALKAAAQALHDEYDAALRRGDLAAAMSIVPRAQAFKKHAIREIGTAWRGFIWPTFLEHTGREIDTMLARVQGQLRSRQEILLGDRMLAEHAAFAAQLLDPAETELVKTAWSAAIRTTNLGAGCATDTLGTLSALSRQAATELDAFVKGSLRTASSIIHPVLADHVRREGERFLATLDALPNDEGR